MNRDVNPEEEHRGSWKRVSEGGVEGAMVYYGSCSPSLDKDKRDAPNGPSSPQINPDHYTIPIQRSMGPT